MGIGTLNKIKSIIEIFEDYEGTYEKTEIDLGAPVGKEIW